MVELKLLSWNIFWGLGYPKSQLNQTLKGSSYFYKRNTQKNINQIANLINSLNPHFVAFQEIDGGSLRNGQYNQVQDLTKQLSMNYSYYAVEKDWLRYFNDGNALISTYRPLFVKVEILPFKVEKRNAIFSNYIIGKKKVTIITMHLGAHKSGKTERLQQVKSLAEKINKLKNPVILMGDFNCEPSDEEFQYLIKNTEMKNLINIKTYPTYNPKNIFDNILISKSIKSVKVQVIKTKLSDHFPVFAILKI